VYFKSKSIALYQGTRLGTWTSIRTIKYTFFHHQQESKKKRRAVFYLVLLNLFSVTGMLLTNCKLFKLGKCVAQVFPNSPVTEKQNKI